MDQNYWSVDDFVADSQKLPCTFNIEVPNMGQLQNTDETNIKALSRLELPFWLAELLALNNIVSISKPKAYSARVKAALDAEPTSVQLRHQNVHWYALGMRLAQLMENDDAEMQVLSKAYLGRLPHIFEQTQHLSSATSSAGIGGSSGSGNRSGPSADVQEQLGLATSQAIAAMVSDGPALGMSAGNAMSAEIAEFLAGLDETERLRKSHSTHIPTQGLAYGTF
ncbi:hypothetical protein BCV70DRAFT_196940 [Testicularia cyperi]|uniref:DNA replication complex GINS protein PSF3 n=1 Tax=Testicularia cyperi TaxID=1882483 RepID=A0A317XY54_9BASI|nr:hypothetical protein BCV70DRAFT_196940 [Testicularia cyperi]